MEAALILNRNKADADEVLEALKAAGIEAGLNLVDGDQIADCARAAIQSGAKLVIVGGGDGSISAAAQSLAGTGRTLGILPLGTLNHLARDLGLPMKLAEAAEVIASGRTREIDLAEVDGRIFVNNAAIGLYPLMVIDREAQQERLGRSKRLAMVVASLRTLVRFHHQRLRLFADSEQQRIDSPLLFVGNNDYQLAAPGSGTRLSLDDGRLCVFVMRKKNRRGFLAAVARALLGLTREDDMVRLDDIERLCVGSDRSHIALALDGEPMTMQPPLLFKIRRKALKVIVPGT